VAVEIIDSIIDYYPEYNHIERCEPNSGVLYRGKGLTDEEFMSSPVIIDKKNVHNVHDVHYAVNFELCRLGNWFF